MARRRRKIRLIFVKKRLFEHKVMKPKSTHKQAATTVMARRGGLFLFIFLIFLVDGE
jgi:hypothetical protein